MERQNPSSAPKGDKESQRSVTFPNLGSMARSQIWCPGICPDRGICPGAQQEQVSKVRFLLK